MCGTDSAASGDGVAQPPQQLHPCYEGWPYCFPTLQLHDNTLRLLPTSLCLFRPPRTVQLHRSSTSWSRSCVAPQAWTWFWQHS